jgi:hypothetical protein
MKRLLFVVVFLFVASTVGAQCPSGFDCRQHHVSLFDPEFVFVSGITFGTTGWDVHNTLACVKAQACQESKLLAPVVAKGELASYGVGFGGDVVVLFCADRMRRSRTFMRHVWWVPPLVLSAAHVNGALRGKQLLDDKKKLSFMIRIRF